MSTDKLMLRAMRGVSAAGYGYSDSQFTARRGGQVLRPQPMKSGYPVFVFYVSIDGFARRVVVPCHKAVAFMEWGDAAFADGVHVRHLNGDKLDFSVGNLKIGSPSENYADKSTENRFRVASLGGKTHQKHDAQTVAEIRRVYAENLNGKKLRAGAAKEIYARFNVTAPTLSAIIRKESPYD